MQIPMAEQARPISPNVQVNQINPGGYGAVGQTLANLGGHIENFAYQLMEKRNRADASDFDRTSSQDVETQMGEFYNNAQKNIADDGYVYLKNVNGNDTYITRKQAQAEKIKGVDFHTHVANQAQKLSESKIDYAPNELGKEAWQDSSKAIAFKWQQEAMQYQNQHMAKAVDFKQKDFISQAGATALNAPNYKTAASTYNQFVAETDRDIGTRFSQLQADQYKQSMLSHLSNSTYRGLLNQASVNKDPDEKHALLQKLIKDLTGKSTDKDGSIALMNKGLPPEIKDDVIFKARKEVEISTMQKTAVTHEQMRGLMDAAINNPTAIQAGDVDRMVAKIHQTNGTKDEHRLMEAQLKSAVEAGKQIQKDKLTKPSEWEDVKNVTAAYANTNTRADINEHAIKIQKIVNEQRKELLEQGTASPGKYWATHDPTVRLQEQAAMSMTPGSYKALASSLEAKQKSANQWREYTTPDLRKAYAQALNDSSEMKQAQALTHIQQETGEDFDHVMGELRKDTSLHVPSSAVVAANTPLGPDAIKERAAILKVSNPANQKAITDAYTEIAAVREPASTYKPQNIEDMVNKELQPLQHALLGVDATNSPAYAGIRDAVKYDVMKKAAQRGNVSGLDDDIKTSIASLVNDKFTTVQENNAALGVVVPKYIGGKEMNPDAVRRFIYTARDESFLKKMDIKTPEQFKRDAAVQGIPENEVDSFWLKKVAKEGQWASHSTLANAQLMMPNKDNDGFTLVGDSKNKPVVVPFSQMQEMAKSGDLKSGHPVIDFINNTVGKGVGVIKEGLKQKQIMENKIYRESK